MGLLDGMAERLHKTFVFMALLIDVADERFGKVTGGDEALMFTCHGKVCGYGHMPCS